jgi:hypothetical protein
MSVSSEENDEKVVRIAGFLARILTPDPTNTKQAGLPLSLSLPPSHKSLFTSTAILRRISPKAPVITKQYRKKDIHLFSQERFEIEIPLKIQIFWNVMPS